MPLRATVSLAWWSFFCWLAAKASIPIEDLDPTTMIWPDTSLGLKGQGSFLKLGLLLGLWALSEPSDHVRLLPHFGSAAAFIR